MPNDWTLHQEPHRHYKYKGSWSIRGQRIVGVTDVLKGADNLADWAAAQATAACEQVARDWLGAEAPLATSLLSFGELAALQPEWPDNVRDAKGESGTQAHTYLAWRLAGGQPNAVTRAHSTVAYGLRVAIDAFLRDHMPIVLEDEHGPRLERAVGSTIYAAAGTYDAHLMLGSERAPQHHRLDLKQSRTVQPTHFAQVAAYEEMAVGCGEEASDYLTVLHIDDAGNYKLHSIEVGSVEHQKALGLWHAYLQIKRLTPPLAKLLR